jgi:hypothetical protein
MAHAPIALFVYNRPAHTAATLAALRANDLATASHLFVFSDGPKHADDGPAVEAVRATVHGATGFRSVEVLAKRANAGLAKSIIGGVSRVLADHDRVIVLEDDLVTSPHFLRYMNAALDRYRDHRRVLSVSGYNPPPHIMDFPRGFTADVYFNPRPSSQGWATWSDRWRQADWEVSAFASFRRDASAQRAFDQGGADLTEMLVAEREGRLESWAIRWTFTHFLARAVAVYPVRSYVDNIGHDGTGVHPPNPFLRNDLSRALPAVQFPAEVRVDEEVMRAFRRYYFARALFRRLRRLAARLFGRTP